MPNGIDDLVGAGLLLAMFAQGAVTAGVSLRRLSSPSRPVHLLAAALLPLVVGLPLLLISGALEGLSTLSLISTTLLVVYVPAAAGAVAGTLAAGRRTSHGER